MAPELLFYDGDCGFCHRCVRIVLALDRGGEAFRFAPIDGPTFRERVAPEVAAKLPDGALLVRSAAALHVLRRIGGPWRWLAGLLAWVPEGLRDRLYDAVAGRRGSLFKAPEAACPVLPPQLRARFDP